MLVLVDHNGLIIHCLFDRKAFQWTETIAAQQAFQSPDLCLGFGKLEELSKGKFVSENAVVDALNLIALTLVDVAGTCCAGCCKKHCGADHGL